MDDRELAAIFTVQTAGEALRKKGKKGNATFGKKEKRGRYLFTWALRPGQLLACCYNRLQG